MARPTSGDGARINGVIGTPNNGAPISHDGGGPTLEPSKTAGARLRIASRRDGYATLRDREAVARDDVASQRDRSMTERDAAATRGADPRLVTGAEVVLRAAEHRRRVGAFREEAAAGRAAAAFDRLAAAEDRELARLDRSRAAEDRQTLAAALAVLETDVLTGARGRAAGLRELEAELDRCGRTGATMILVYVDVVGLKALNDSEGHDAGDRLLVRFTAIVRERLRSYDLVIRVGGDEFVCAISSMDLAETRRRFQTIGEALAGSDGGGGLRLGFAELVPGETGPELIARADADLLASSAGGSGAPDIP